MKAINQKRWSDPSEHEKAAEAWRGEKSPVHLALRARARNNYGGSWPERKMAWWLTQNGIAFEPQWLFRYGPNQRRGFADFYLQGVNIVIECDGPTHREDPVVQERDLAKNAHFLATGISILRFTDEQIRYRFSEVASTIRERCCLVRHQIKRLEHRIIHRQTVYHLSVEGDRSFIASGIVVHNCDDCAALDGEEVGMDESFSDGEYAPPDHVNCRCAVGLSDPVLADGVTLDNLPPNPNILSADRNQDEGTE